MAANKVNGYHVPASQSAHAQSCDRQRALPNFRSCYSHSCSILVRTFYLLIDAQLTRLLGAICRIEVFVSSFFLLLFCLQRYIILRIIQNYWVHIWARTKIMYLCIR